VKAQRALAVLLTFLLFALVIFGLGALFAVFHHRVWGYVAGVVTCAVMTYAGINSLRGNDVTGRPGGAGKPASGKRAKNSGAKGGKGPGPRSPGGGSGAGRGRSGRG
jgi:hypothetical protein